jgi:ataxia telangiectasia mutated family protein
VTDEFHYSSQYSHLATPLDLINLMRACSGMTLLGNTGTMQVFGGPIAQFRQSLKELQPMLRYLLLLEDAEISNGDEQMSQNCLVSNDTDQVTDPTGSHTAKRMILELMFPKLEQVLQLAESWSKKGGEGASQISTEKLQSAVLCCFAGILILPELRNLNSAMSRDLESLVFKLVDSCLKAVLESDQNDGYFDMLLASAAPYVPQLTTSDLRTSKEHNEFLLRYFEKLSECLEERSRRESLSQGVDAMEIDDDFLESQANSQKSSSSNSTGLPRRDVYLCHTPEAFNLDMRFRLRLLAIVSKEEGQLGLVPEVFLDEVLTLPTEQLLCCRVLMQQLFNSDLITTADDAARVIETMGEIMSTKDFSYCEAALCLVLEMMDAFIGLWTDDKLDISSMVGDLYNHFVKYALPKNELSPTAQAYLSKLLFRLLEVSPNYAAGLKLPSCRSTLLSILRDGAMRVKYVIGNDLPKIFGLYVLKAHDEIFLDILESLPSDPKGTEGIALRLQVLAELACNWSTLLRRSVYHIFETPGRIDQATKYAASCVRRISRSLNLETPRELFRLFAPQLLYTWLETDSIDTMRFEIFGFPALQDLLVQAQTEAAAIMIMRGQEQEALGLAEALGLTAPAMLQQGFTKIMAYSIAHDISVRSSPMHVTGESRVRKLLGKEAFHELVYLNFADIVATFLDIFDQEDPVEKVFRKDESFSYAADVMDQIKQLGHLDTVLPPNQQPMFKAKYLTRELEYLCSRTEYELHSLWTPSMVVAVARNLLNKVHPALGPLHACSVLRKIRVLICLAGPQALTSYPLEMLLHSTRVFLKDPECADDALGVSRYLIQNGGHHLRQAPSFLAGYALSSLADLRVFLESSQSSTTQESQFKATLGKAQQFHAWFSKYLSSYDSPAFKDDEHRQAFKSITQSAAHIRASGNADKGTPESNLLLEILKDDERDSQLLNDPAREVALDMLCGVFTAPDSSRADAIENDEEALAHGAIVLKSCRSDKLSDDYLAWGGRVVGRSFLASGEIPAELLRESRLSEYRKLSSDNSGSEHGILNILEALTVSSDCATAGLAESALRTIVSEAILEADNGLLAACQKSLSESLLASSNWDQYRTPPSDHSESKIKADADALSAGLLESESWPQRVAIHLAHSVPDIVVLNVLPPILANVKGCAGRAFPFIVHLVLLSQLDKQQGIKRQLSKALEGWLQSTSTASRENLKLLLNTILYLRTQRLPNETSIADRSHWLDVNFSAAAAAATTCGMFKVALLFAELASSEGSRASRRSSAAREIEDSSETLLQIFESIDDPDAYYGLSQDASLATVLARLEYENDGIKSLAFRGAQYDSHLRRRDSGAQHDGQQLIKSLTSVGLAGLSHSLLQAQQSLDGSSTSLDSTFTTARRLEVWNLPVPPNRDSHAVNLYKAYQTMHKAEDIGSVREAIHDGLKHTIRLLSSQNLTAANLRHHLGALASLTELDDLISVTDKPELEAMLSSFSTRSKWMMSGR